MKNLFTLPNGVVIDLDQVQLVYQVDELANSFVVVMSGENFSFYFKSLDIAKSVREALIIQWGNK